MNKLKQSIDKFSFGQLTSNNNGKTSASGTAGLYIIAIGGVCFLLGCADKMFFDNSVDIITQSIMLIGIGVTLLGYRKSKDSISETLEKDSELDTHTEGKVSSEEVQQLNS
jgi:hypothetical protein